jgi:nickel-type superoxide dismutase maturation protease
VRLIVGVAAGLVALAAIAALAGRWVDIVEVRGRSMAPSLLPGDLLVVERWTYRGRRPRRGDVVLVRDPRSPRRELVKRITATDAGHVAVRGDAPDASTDSRTFGQLPVAAVRWRVALRYWPPTRIGFVGRVPAPLASAAAAEVGDRLDA